jgi:hypothetical protein
VSAVTARFEPQQTSPGRPAGRENPTVSAVLARPHRSSSPPSFPSLFAPLRPVPPRPRHAAPSATTGRPVGSDTSSRRPRYVPFTSTSPHVTTSSVPSRHRPVRSVTSPPRSRRHVTARSLPSRYNLVRSLVLDPSRHRGTKSRGTVPRTGRASERNARRWGRVHSHHCVRCSCVARVGGGRRQFSLAR